MEEADCNDESYEDVEEAIEQLSRVMARKTLPTASPATAVGKGTGEAGSGGGEEAGPRKLHSTRYAIRYGELKSQKRKK